jgi:hypothetical protein
MTPQGTSFGLIDSIAKIVDENDGDWFHCYTTTNEYIHITSLNNGHCDCSDGSDEPATGACSDVHRTWKDGSNPLLVSLSVLDTFISTPNTSTPTTILSSPTGLVTGMSQDQLELATYAFSCKNRPFGSKTILSSLVNDGICDCCDGSDEWQYPDLCKNRCGDVIEKKIDDMNQFVSTLDQIASFNYPTLALQSYELMTKGNIDELDQILNLAKSFPNLGSKPTQSQTTTSRPKPSFPTFLQSTNLIHSLGGYVGNANVQKLDGILSVLTPVSNYIDLRSNYRHTQRSSLKRSSPSPANSPSRIVSGINIPDFGYVAPQINGADEQGKGKNGQGGRMFAPTDFECPAIAIGEFLYEICINNHTEQFSLQQMDQPGTMLGSFYGVFDGGQNGQNGQNNVDQNDQLTTPYSSFYLFESMSLDQFRQPYVPRRDIYLTKTQSGVEMKFTRGDPCWNGVQRSVTLTLKCGLIEPNPNQTQSQSQYKKNNSKLDFTAPQRLFQVIELTEPSMCKYNGIIVSPLACSPADLLLQWINLQNEVMIEVQSSIKDLDHTQTNSGQIGSKMDQKVVSKAQFQAILTKQSQLESTVSNFLSHTPSPTAPSSSASKKYPKGAEELWKLALEWINNGSRLLNTGTHPNGQNGQNIGSSLDISIYNTLLSRYRTNPSLFIDPIDLLPYDQMWFDKVNEIESILAQKWSKSELAPWFQFREATNYPQLTTNGEPYNLFGLFDHLRVSGIKTNQGGVTPAQYRLEKKGKHDEL